MSAVRKIAEIIKSQPTIEGAGVKLKRAFGYHHLPLFDPFLLLDDFHSDNPKDYSAGFPWHLHRGITQAEIPEISPQNGVKIKVICGKIDGTQGPQGVRFLLISGQPISEPIAWQGPIVMNTDQELALAFKEFENGTFIKTA